uniref:RNase H type-1 domain-containing protein n=1 Tax=Cannabis sativa TaxID=3483 RepID=A0A803P3B5_CANSA
MRRKSIMRSRPWDLTEPLGLMASLLPSSRLTWDTIRGDLMAMIMILLCHSDSDFINRHQPSAHSRKDNPVADPAPYNHSCSNCFYQREINLGEHCDGPGNCPLYVKEEGIKRFYDDQIGHGKGVRQNGLGLYPRISAISWFGLEDVKRSSIQDLNYGEGLCGRIGDGSSTSMQFDPWCHRVISSCPLTDATERPSTCLQLYVQFAIKRVNRPYTCFGIVTTPQPFGLAAAGVLELISVRNWEEWTDWFECNRNRPATLSFNDFMTGALCIFDFIWKVQNEVIHGGHLLQISKAMSIASMRFNGHLARKMDQPATTAASVLTPPSGVVTDRFPVTDPALAEASMLLSAAKHATQSNFSSVNFFCDNVCVVSNILKAHGTHHNINLEGVSTHFQMLTAQFANWSVQKINRKENFMAHNAAKWAKINSAIGNIQFSSMDPKVFEDYKEWWPDP